MKKLFYILLFSVLTNTCFSQTKQIPQFLIDPKWEDPQKSGFLIATDGTKTEVMFNSALRYSIKEVCTGSVIYTIKGTTKVLRSIGDQYSSFQIDDKTFERHNLTLKNVRKVKFMPILAKGKIDMYQYIYYSSNMIDSDGVSHEGNYYITYYFLRKNSTKEEIITNDEIGLKEAIPLFFDNEKIKEDYNYKQYNVLGNKEGMVKGIDLLKMVKDYNAAK